MLNKFRRRWFLKKPDTTTQFVLKTKQVGTILQNSNYQISKDPEFEQIATLLRQGKDILAAKTYREQTGSSLLEAKQTIDFLKVELDLD